MTTSRKPGSKRAPAVRTVSTKAAAAAIAPTPAAAPAPVWDWSLAQLQQLAAWLDAVPAPLEPLDVMMLDGFLTAVSLLPGSPPPGLWWPHVLDIDARPLPAGCAADDLRAAVVTRQRELRKAIDARQWFDPWVFELDDGETVLDALQPWSAGFALAVDAFDSPMQRDAPEILEPLAVIYRALDADDLADAGELLAVIDMIEPPVTLADAVEDMVAAVLHIADVTRPMSAQPHPPARRRGR